MKLIQRKVAASILGMTERNISYYVARGYLKAHYVLGNNKHYLVDEAEVRAQFDLIELRAELYRQLRIREEQVNPRPRKGNRWTTR